MSGFKIAALYGFAPHMLGLCGPKEARRQQLLKKFLQEKISEARMRSVFKRFMGAYGYYRLIAKSNRIKDPFDGRVVSAYWIGNELLDKVKIEDLREMVTTEFSGPGLLSRELAAKKAKAIPEGSKPHHSFHVLVIGSVTGSVDFTGNIKLKDLCRIGWGRVIKFNALQPPLKKRGGGLSLFQREDKGELIKITVEYQPLVGDKKIKLGRPAKKEVLWDKKIMPGVNIGDWVAFHWNWLVQILNKKEKSNLEKYTIQTIKSLERKKFFNT